MGHFFGWLEGKLLPIVRSVKTNKQLSAVPLRPPITELTSTLVSLSAVVVSDCSVPRGEHNCHFQSAPGWPCAREAGGVFVLI